jgi:hypothetical protein
MEPEGRGHEEREKTMDMLILLVVSVLFSLAAWKWGVDSAESINSPEWKRRETRAMFL